MDTFQVCILCLVSVVQGASNGQGRIVAVGDMHGDITTATAILQSAGVLGGDGATWVGGTTTVVQTGDLVDRGPDGHGLIDLFLSLREQAAAAGGRVHLLVGNHELMNIKSELTFVDSRDTQSHGSPEARAKAYSAEGRYGAYIRALPMSVAIGSTVFCHGGLLETWAKAGTSAINAAAKGAVDANQMYAPVLMNDGPVWTRYVIEQSLAGRCGVLERSLAALSQAEGRTIERMVIGHTAQPGGKMAFLCDGRLAAIDVYASAFYSGGGFNTFLEINDTSSVSWAQVGPIQMPVQEIRAKASKALTQPSTTPFDAELFASQGQHMLEAEAEIEAKRGGEPPKKEQLPSHEKGSEGGREHPVKLEIIGGRIYVRKEPAINTLKFYFICASVAFTLVIGVWWRFVVIPRKSMAHSKNS